MIRFIRTFEHDLPLPSRGTPQSAGLDLCAAERVELHPGKRKLVSTGWSWDMSHSFNVYGRVAPRSGLAVKHGIDVMAGVIDADYQGEIKVPLINLGTSSMVIQKGDRMAQLIIEVCDYEVPVIEANAHTTDTLRGEGGFGSTGG